MKYKIEYKSSVRKDLKNVDISKVRYVLNEIEKLSTKLSISQSIKKLQGFENYYRLKLKHDLRVIFTKNDETLIILVIKISHRREIYKKI